MNVVGVVGFEQWPSLAVIVPAGSVVNKIEVVTHTLFAVAVGAVGDSRLLVAIMLESVTPPPEPRRELSLH